MVVFHKLCRTAQSSTVHKTESVSVMGHARSVTVCSIGSDQRQRTFFSHFSSFWGAILPDRYCVAERRCLVIRFRCHVTLTFDLENARTEFVLL